MSISKQQEFYIDGIDLACAIKSFDGNTETSMLDSTAICNTGARSYITGLKTGTLSASGIWNYDTTNADEIDDVIKSAFANNTAQVITASMGAVTAGTTYAIMLEDAKVSSYNLSSELDALIMLDFELQSDNGGIEAGIFLYKNNVTSGSDNGTGVDNTASSSNGGLFQAHLYEEADSTATDGTFTLQHSTDNAVWADLVSATAVGDSKGSVQAVVASGTTVNRYLRVQFTATGGKGYGIASFARR